MTAIGLCLSALGCASSATTSSDSGARAAGRKLAHDWQKGNCLACHKIPGDAQAVTSADIGPTLQDIKARYPNRAQLRARIWDARGTNPDTVMPPFGTSHILTENEIDKIVDYLYAY
jgi:sulfur-oxidizing protein SoxX